MLDRILRDYKASAADLPLQSEAAARGRRAAQQLAQWGLPSARDEDWRYANLRALEAVSCFRPATRTATLEHALPAPIEGFARLVYLNGRLYPDSSTPAGKLTQPPGLSEAEAAASVQPDQRLGLLNEMFATDRAQLRVRGEAAIEVIFLSTAQADGAAVYPQLAVQLEPGGRLQLIERHLGAPGQGALVCANCSIHLQRGASLTHHRLQQCEARAVFVDTVSALVEEDAAYTVRSVAVGAASARSSASIRLVGQRAALLWHGLAVGQGEQVHDALLKVEHGAAATRTEEVFRGIAADRSRVAFNAQINIKPAAPGSQARQSLRGLVDGSSAEIDLRPRLEIHTDDVRAQHGATTGQLDENLLFYLLARGIERSTARTLLKWAFLGEVLTHIDVPAVRRAAEQAAAGQLSDVLAAGAFT